MPKVKKTLSRAEYLVMVGSKLRKLREVAGLSIPQLAEKAGLAPVTVAAYERGDWAASIANLGQLVYFFGVGFDDLLMPGDIDFLEKLIKEQKKKGKWNYD